MNSQPIPVPCYSLTDAQICRYLQDDPAFFRRNEDLLAQLDIPHASGAATSLLERQIALLRQQNSQLQQQLQRLCDTALQNERLYRHFDTLSRALLQCDSLSAALAVLHNTLCTTLGHACVKLLLRDLPAEQQPDCLSISADILAQIRQKRLDGSGAYFGRLANQERTQLGLEPSIASVALLPLGEHGLLVIGSLSAEHFNPQMDSLLISRLAVLLNAQLARWQDRDAHRG